MLDLLALCVENETIAEELPAMTAKDDYFGARDLGSQHISSLLEIPRHVDQLPFGRLRESTACKR